MINKRNKRRARSCLEGIILSILPFNAIADWQNTPFIRGDADQRGELVSISDSLYILNYIFNKGETPKCLDSADWDDNGKINIVDAVGILYHVIRPGGGGYAIEPDNTPDTLDCKEYNP